jgi:hypothetical protein
MKPGRGDLECPEQMKYPRGHRIARELLPAVSCPECKSKLVRTPDHGTHFGHWCCPKGHGKLLPDGLFRERATRLLGELAKEFNVSLKFWTFKKLLWKLSRQQSVDYQ